MKQSRAELLARRYAERQGTHRTGAEYQAAIRATPKEAPSLSRCSEIWSPQAQRKIQALSVTEVMAAVIALFHPALVDLLEQRCLPIEPDINPASLYMPQESTRMTGMLGTLDVAERLGLTRFHPKFIVVEEGEKYYAPLPLVGDFLLILRDQVGVYPVNWTVKISEAAFEEQLGKRPLRRGSATSVEEARARHRLEEVCYGDAGIPTHRIVQTTFDRTLVANLCQLILWVPRQATLTHGEREAMVDAFRCIVGSDRAPLDLLVDLTKQFNCERQDCLVVLHQALWHREIVIDLFKPFVINRPMDYESVSPFQRYSKFFARGSK